MQEDGKQYNGQAYLAYKIPGAENGAMYFSCNLGASNSLDGLLDCDFIFAPFNREAFPVIQLDFIKEMRGFGELEFSLPDINQEAVDFKNYKIQFDSVQDVLQKTELKKLVLSRCKRIEQNGMNPCEIFERLTIQHPNAFTYLLYIPNMMCWIGSSPEPVLQYNDSGILTTALAGTQAYEGVIEDIRWGDKEKEEQRYIMDYLDDVLKSRSIPFRNSEPHTAVAGAMCHIRSDYYINPAASIAELMAIVHPGPALSGYPRLLAETMIPKIERHTRKLYTGFFGRSGKKQDVLFYANLRCMELAKDSAWVYVGGGITQDSQLEKEWQETELKSRTMIDAMHFTNYTLPYEDIR